MRRSDERYHVAGIALSCEKYSVFNNSILIELNAGVVDNFELFSGRLTDFAIEKRIDAYRIDKELTDAEISKAFEEILTKETEEAAQKG